MRKDGGRPPATAVLSISKGKKGIRGRRRKRDPRKSALEASGAARRGAEGEVKKAGREKS